MAPVHPTAQARPDVALRAAMETETVKGDLKGAIEQYKTIAQSADRATAATALIRMADCYLKLGDAQARTIYERLVREFADQKEAVSIARARLGGASAAPMAKGDRSLWRGGDVDLFGTVSPDGRFLTYTDWALTNNIMLRDLVAGTSRPLTGNTTYGQYGYPGWSAISRDGNQFVFVWTPPQSPDELRVASFNGTGVPPSRRLRQFEQGESVRPFDWSPDGKWIAVLVERTGRSSLIGLVSVVDGTLRPLKSVDWRGVNKMVFSADGRFIAYDSAVTEPRPEAQILVMAVDGSREHVVIDDPSENRVMGWAADGHLVFASNRSGALSLWVVRVEDGRAMGAPRLVKENIGWSWSLGMTPSGTLYTWKRASSPYVRITADRFAIRQAAGCRRRRLPAFHRVEGTPFLVCGWQALRLHLVRSHRWRTVRALPTFHRDWRRPSNPASSSLSRLPAPGTGRPRGRDRWA